MSSSRSGGCLHPNHGILDKTGNWFRCQHYPTANRWLVELRGHWWAIIDHMPKQKHHSPVTSLCSTLPLIGGTWVEFYHRPHCRQLDPAPQHMAFYTQPTWYCGLCCLCAFQSTHRGGHLSNNGHWQLKESTHGMGETVCGWNWSDQGSLLRPLSSCPCSSCRMTPPPLLLYSPPPPGGWARDKIPSHFAHPIPITPPMSRAWADFQYNRKLRCLLVLAFARVLHATPAGIWCHLPVKALEQLASAVPYDWVIWEAPFVHLSRGVFAPCDAERRWLCVRNSGKTLSPPFRQPASISALIGTANGATRGLTRAFCMPRTPPKHFFSNCEGPRTLFSSLFI